ncbi:MAG: PqqD family protein [Actinomycetota bacterium]
MALLHRAPNALSRRVLRGVMVLTPADDEPFLITPPGDVVWEILAEPIDLEDLVDLLSGTYDGDKTQITADVAALIETLIDKGAVELA